MNLVTWLVVGSVGATVLLYIVNMTRRVRETLAATSYISRDRQQAVPLSE